MARPTAHVEWQTCRILQRLLADEECVDLRCGDLEVDGPGDDDDGFNAALIAARLRAVGDELNGRSGFQEALAGLQREAVKKSLEQAFSSGVEAVCRAQEAQGGRSPEVAPELRIIQASAAVGLYLKKTFPELTAGLQTAMLSFLNRRVGRWVDKQGGWEGVSGL